MQQRFEKLKDQIFESEIEWLLFHLWVKPAAFKFKVPETVILRKESEEVISNWFFTASQGQILKKNKSNLNTQNLSRGFIRKLNSNFDHAAATAYHFDHSEKKNILTLEHIATHDFPSYCNMVEKQNGKFKIPKVLQKFVYSKSSKNQMVRCIWSSEDCKIERCFNIYSMYDSKIDLKDRVGTFEVQGPSTIDSSIPEVISLELTEAILQIREHLQITSDYKMEAGTFYFKYDKNDHLYLTFVSGIVLNQECESLLNITRGLNTALKSVFKPQPSTNVTKPPLKRPIAFTEPKSLAPNPFSAPFSERAPESLRSTESVGILKVSSKKILPSLNFQKACPCCTLEQETPMIYEFTISYLVRTYPQDSIPEPISRLYPNLNTFQKFQQKMNDPAFIYQPVKICDNCYSKLKDGVATFENTSYQDNVQSVIHQEYDIAEIAKTIQETEREQRDTILYIEPVQAQVPGLRMRPQSSKPAYGQSLQHYSQPSQSTIRNSRQSEIDKNRKRFEGFNSFFNIKSNLELQKIQHQQQQIYGAGHRKKPMNPAKQKRIFAQLSAGGSSVAGIGIKQVSEQDFTELDASSQMMKSRPQSSKMHNIQVASHVGTNSLQKLKSSLSNAGMKTNVNLYQEEVKVVRRPQSGKPPQFISSSYAPPIQMKTDWDKEYDDQILRKTTQQKDAIFNILDSQINKLSQGEVDEEDLGIQEINESDESQDIFDNFEKTQKNVKFIENKKKSVEQHKVSVSSNKIVTQSKLKKPVLSSRYSQQSAYNQQRAQVRRNIVSAKTKILPPMIKQPLKKKVVKQSSTGLFNFDPNNLNEQDIKSIAQNADKLIDIISNIKKSVSRPESNIVIQEQKQNLDLEETKSENQNLNESVGEVEADNESVGEENESVGEEIKQRANLNLSPIANPDILLESGQEIENSAQSDIGFAMLNNQIKKANQENWW